MIGIIIIMLLQAICAFCFVKHSKRSTYLAIGCALGCAIPVLGITFIILLTFHLGTFEEF